MVFHPPEGSILTMHKELSAEAKALLGKVVAGDRKIMYGLYLNRGEQIENNREPMISDANARTIQGWIAGFKDSNQRRYIKDDSHKGEVFKVTPEGYEAAEALSDA